MSGGYFEYKQYHINDIVDDICRLIRYSQSSESQWKYSSDTISRFYEAIHYLEIAKVYAHRIDWLLCGDDSEESFHKNLDEELSDL